MTVDILEHELRSQVLDIDLMTIADTLTVSVRLSSDLVQCNSSVDFNHESMIHKIVLHNNS